MKYRIVLWGDNTYTVQRRFFFIWSDITNPMSQEHFAREWLLSYEERRANEHRSRRMVRVLP